MSDKVVYLNVDAAKMLRNIADKIESGEFNGECVTVVMYGTVFHGGKEIDDHKAFRRSIFDCELAKHELLSWYIEK